PSPDRNPGTLRFHLLHASDRFYALLEIWRSAEVGDLLANPGMKLERIPMQGCTGRTIPKMPLNFQIAHQVEFTINIALDQGLSFCATHLGPPSPLAATMQSRNRARARASRDITVPTGTPAISLISL